MHPKGPFVKGLVHLVLSMVHWEVVESLRCWAWCEEVGSLGDMLLQGILDPSVLSRFLLPSLPSPLFPSLWLLPLSLFFSLSLDPPSAALLQHGTSYHDALQTRKQWYGVSMSRHL